MVRWLGTVVGVLGMMSVACADSGPRITVTELGQALQTGPLRIELLLDGTGKAAHLEVDRAAPKADEVQDRVQGVEAAGLGLANFGQLVFTDGQLFEIYDRDSTRDAFILFVKEALGRGEVVTIEAKGRLDADGFHASKIEVERPQMPKLKTQIGASDLDAASATLRVRSLSWALDKAVITWDD